MPLHSVVTSGSAVAALLSNLATRIEGFGLLLGARCSLEGRYTQEARDQRNLKRRSCCSAGTIRDRSVQAATDTAGRSLPTKKSSGRASLLSLTLHLTLTLQRLRSHSSKKLASQHTCAVHLGCLQRLWLENLKASTILSVPPDCSFKVVEHCR